MSETLQIDVRPNGRYRVQSRTREEIKHLVKWVASENGYTCSCEWGSMGDPLKKCAHILAVEKQYGKACQICGNKGEWQKSFNAPWEEMKALPLYLCGRCDESLRKFYS